MTQTWTYDELGHLWGTVDAANSTVDSRHYIPASGQTGHGYRYHLSSNPYLTQNESTRGWTQTVLDTSGRVVAVQHFSGSDLPAPSGPNSVTGQAQTSYAANTTTVTDERGTLRTTTVDTLGRLVREICREGSGR